MEKKDLKLNLLKEKKLLLVLLMVFPEPKNMVFMVGLNGNTLKLKLLGTLFTDITTMILKLIPI